MQLFTYHTLLFAIVIIVICTNLANELELDPFWMSFCWPKNQEIIGISMDFSHDLT